jgi:hypothetical protein
MLSGSSAEGEWQARSAGLDQHVRGSIKAIHVEGFKHRAGPIVFVSPAPAHDLDVPAIVAARTGLGVRHQ